MEPSVIKDVQKVMASVILLGVFFGGLGNVMVVYMIVKKRHLQTKSGILLAITASCHLLCLLSEIVHAVYIILDSTIDGEFCFKMLLPYEFSLSLQFGMYLAMITDLLLATAKPIWYNRANTLNFVFYCTSPAFMFATIATVFSVKYHEDVEIPECNPIVVLKPFFAQTLVTSYIGLNTLTLMAYITTISVFYLRRSKTSSQTKQVMKRLSVMALVFILTGYANMLGATLLYLVMDVDKATMQFMQSTLVVFAILNYSQNFYVTIWKSTMYRNAFIEIALENNIIPCIATHYKQRKLSQSNRTIQKPNHSYSTAVS